MKNPYKPSISAEQDIAAQALEDMICSSGAKMLKGCLTTQVHTDFELPEDDGALVVVRFAGPDAVEKAKRLRCLIDAWR